LRRVPRDVRAWLTGFHEEVLLPANPGHEAAGVVVEAGRLGPALPASDATTFVTENGYNSCRG
jgi:D-arabinose 1-dehydrogenase-like Zn-dependent alcohol dehydrogenase